MHTPPKRPQEKMDPGKKKHGPWIVTGPRPHPLREARAGEVVRVDIAREERRSYKRWNIHKEENYKRKHDYSDTGSLASDAFSQYQIMRIITFFLVLTSSQDALLCNSFCGSFRPLRILNWQVPRKRRMPADLLARSHWVARHSPPML